MSRVNTKRIVLTAVWLGMVGGLLKNLHVLINFLFVPQGSKNIYVITSLLFAEQLLFVSPICATRGVAERSARLLRAGILIGGATGLVTGGIILSLAYIGFKENTIFASWFDYILVSAPLLGLAAGIVSSTNEKSRRIVYSYALIGLIAGSLAVFSYYLTVSLTTLTELFLSKMASAYIGYLFHKFLNPPIIGIAVSCTIWWFMALAEERMFSNTR